MGYVCINLFPLIDVSTIVGLDICPPSDAAERVPLYHRASPLNHLSPHTRLDTAFSPGIYPRHRCSLWIYPPTHWVYTRVSPFALEIYEDNTHIKPSIGHGINTGTHMWQRVPVLIPCPILGLIWVLSSYISSAKPM